MIDIKQRFFKHDIINTFQRVDSEHVLDLYIGLDEMSRYTLFLISELEPKQIFSSKIINVQIGKRYDSKWGISFSLINNKFEDIFCHFCSDIINSSRIIEDKNKGAEFVCLRYTKWQKMLSKSSGELLSPAEIKGLIGEIYFLKEYLIPIYGQDIAINSWIGPDKADQDFVCANKWYEIKSTVSGAESITITSVEQLDTASDGELVIIYLDKTSYSDEHKISLNSIYYDVYNLLENVSLKQKLSDILLKLGYYKRPEYDEHIFKFTKIDRYNVDSKFPCVRKVNISSSIVNCRYDLSISSINIYRKESEHGVI